MAADDRVCACGCGRPVRSGSRLVVTARTKYATPQCSALACVRRTSASRAARWQATADARRAAGRCPRCGALPAPGLVQCAQCVEAQRARRAQGRDASTDLPQGVLSNARIDAIIRHALERIRWARRAGDPTWTIDPWAQVHGYGAELTRRGPETSEEVWG